VRLFSCSYKHTNDPNFKIPLRFQLCISLHSIGCPLRMPLIRVYENMRTTSKYTSPTVAGVIPNVTIHLPLLLLLLLVLSLLLVPYPPCYCCSNVLSMVVCLFSNMLPACYLLTK
jgi:hypothetical protein